MLVSISIQASDPHAVTADADAPAESRKTVAVLDELLGQSIRLRDLYRNARWQTADIQYRRLRHLFDHHYKEQLRLVDVLTDRIRLLGEARQLFASKFLQGTHFACALKGNKAAGRLLRELLDAHESVLSAVRPNDSVLNQQWAHDFAVGQVALTNDSQSLSIIEQLAELEPTQRHIGLPTGAVLDYD
jgi:starvation-inducible DNA-binding protein